ncbi:MAG: hypothetical protein ACLFUU_12970 [Desulfobacteraceae bacterium]
MLPNLLRSLGVLSAILIFGIASGQSQAQAPGEPLNFKELFPFVNIELNGWERVGEPEGKTVKGTPMMMSQAKAEYKSGDQSLEITVVDSSFGPMAAMGMGLMKGMEVESTEESTKTIEVQGFQAVETYKPKAKQGQLTIMVGNRFIVSLEGQGIDNIQVLKDVAEKIELKKLADIGQ